MNVERPGVDAGRQEKKERLTMTPPALELLLNPVMPSIWPEAIATDKEFVDQCSERESLINSLETVTGKLRSPESSMQEAVRTKSLTESEAAGLYGKLSTLLENNDYKRAALYMPFEFLPEESWQPETEALREALVHFKQAYMQAWRSLLSFHDVRANFVDGDVIELDERIDDWPRVVKAAHLIPTLVEKGLLTMDEVTTLMDESGDALLKQNIAESMRVMEDLNNPSGVDFELSAPEAASLVDLAQVQERLQHELEQMMTRDFGPATKNRKAWLQQEGRRQAFRSASGGIHAAVINGQFNSETLGSYVESGAVAMTYASIEGIREAIEETAKADQSRAREMFDQYRGDLARCWLKKQPETQDVLAKLFFRLNALQVVRNEELQEFGLTRPNLAGPFSENVEPQSAEMQDVQTMLETIDTDPELSKRVYPVLLVHGSRLKGYGTQESDIDLSVFVRPETPPGDRGSLKERLDEVFRHKNVPEGALEFWLEEKEGQVSIRDAESYDTSLADKSFAHILFGAVWEGDQAVVNELRAKVLVPYFYDTGDTLYGRDARGIYLEQIERDVLQYRLLHKGYERFFPRTGYIQTEHANHIDGDSTFFDSGYRQTALRLFARNVFLPKLKS
jgi:predicted nucleotidyltransferase